MSYFVAKIVFPLKFEKNLGVDLGSELVPVDLRRVRHTCWRELYNSSCTRQIRVLEICISL